MKKNYLEPEVQLTIILPKKNLLDASLSRTSGENFDSEKDTYSWDWTDEE